MSRSQLSARYDAAYWTGSYTSQQSCDENPHFGGYRHSQCLELDNYKPELRMIWREHGAEIEIHTRINVFTGEQALQWLRAINKHGWPRHIQYMNESRIEPACAD